jgi:hypothetical protein
MLDSSWSTVSMLRTLNNPKKKRKQSCSETISGVDLIKIWSTAISTKRNLKHKNPTKGKQNSQGTNYNVPSNRYIQTKYCNHRQRHAPTWWRKWQMHVRYAVLVEASWSTKACISLSLPIEFP